MKEGDEYCKHIPDEFELGKRYATDVIADFEFR